MKGIYTLVVLLLPLVALLPSPAVAADAAALSPPASGDLCTTPDLSPPHVPATPSQPHLTLDQLARVQVVTIPLEPGATGRTPRALDISGVLYRPADGSVQTLQNARIALTLEDVAIPSADDDTLKPLLTARGIYADAKALGILRALNLNPPALLVLAMPRVIGGPIVQKARSDGYLVALRQDYLTERLYDSLQGLKAARKRLAAAPQPSPADARLDALTGSVQKSLDPLHRLAYASREQRSRLDQGTWQRTMDDAYQLAALATRVTRNETLPPGDCSLKLSSDDVAAAARIAESMALVAKPLPPAPAAREVEPPSPVLVQVRVRAVYGKDCTLDKLRIHCAPFLEYPSRLHEVVFRKLSCRHQPDDQLPEEVLPEAYYTFWAEDAAVPAKEIPTPVSTPLPVKVRRWDSDKPVELPIP